jgi:hypothetical protein
MHTVSIVMLLQLCVLTYVTCNPCCITAPPQWDSYDVSGPHRNLIELQECFYQAQRILHISGAFVRQFLVDDKGCVLIACWGVPHLSYLDNAQRALASAAQIRCELEKRQMHCSFGITTGDVYCGTVGSALRMEYAAIGSVVNLSARLMSKAHGGILIDDATHARLPNNILDSLETLEPIKVKGMDEPMRVHRYSATTVEALHVKELIVQDHEIPAVCRNTLVTILNGMVADASTELISPGSMKSWLLATVLSSKKHQAAQGAAGTVSETGTGANTGAGTGGQNSSLQLALITGKEGSGRTTVVVWLKKQATNRQISVYGVKLNKKDTQVQFSAWKKMFVQMMPKDLFLNNDTQRAYVRALLKEVYPTSPHLAETVGYPALRAALGITCGFNHPPAKGSPSSLEREVSSHWRPSPEVRLSKKSTPADSVPLSETLFKIFSHLLTSQTALVVFENMEVADEMSLKLLVDLMKINSSSVIVLSALSEAGATAAQRRPSLRPSTSPDHVTSIHITAFNSTAWSRVFKEKITRNRNTSVIVLENFSSDDIEKMLSVSLGTPNVPVEILQIVQDFSGGSYFWVREILQFLTEHGAEGFLSAIGESSSEVEATEKSAVTDASGTHSGVDGLKLARAKPKIHGMPPSPTNLLRPSSSSRSMGGGRETSMRSIGRSQSFRNPQNNRTINSRIQVKLDKLVLCRFENLSIDVQRVLRMASIIGMSFTSMVLCGVLPRRLKGQMSNHIKTLTNLKWLYQDTDNESLYQFAHPHAHQIIYELTPSSERNQHHRAIGDYLEETYGDNKSQYAQLSYHYQNCDIDKSMRYAVKALPVLLSVDSVYDFAECVDFLFFKMECCTRIVDLRTLHQMTNEAKLYIEQFKTTGELMTATRRGGFVGGVLRLFRAMSCTGADAAAVASLATKGKGDVCCKYKTTSVVPTGGSVSSLLELDAGTVQSESGDQGVVTSIAVGATGRAGGGGGQDTDEEDSDRDGLGLGRKRGSIRNSLKEQYAALEAHKNELIAKAVFIEQLVCLGEKLTERGLDFEIERDGYGETGSNLKLLAVSELEGVL